MYCFLVADIKKKKIIIAMTLIDALKGDLMSVNIACQNKKKIINKRQYVDINRGLEATVC